MSLKTEFRREARLAAALAARTVLFSQGRGDTSAAFPLKNRKGGGQSKTRSAESVTVGFN